MKTFEGLILSAAAALWLPGCPRECDPLVEICAEAAEPDVSLPSADGGHFPVPDLASQAGCSPEQCDGEDNDCDGRVDEDILPTEVTCPAEACQERAPASCQGGVWVDACRRPSDEVCDGADNDCNGSIDDLGDCYEGPAGTMGHGRCQPGRWACDAATGRTTCVGQVVPDVERRNDHIDADCDGDDEEDVPHIVCLTCGGDSISVPVEDLEPLRLHPMLVTIEPPDAPIADPVARLADIEDRKSRIVAEALPLAAATGGTLLVEDLDSHTYAFAVEADKIAIGWLLENPRVHTVMENLPVRLSLRESSGLVGATRARREGGVNGRGVVIGLVDSGLDYGHPAFGACEPGSEGCPIVGGLDLNDDDDPMDEDERRHGTVLAGVVAGRSVDGSAAGMAPGASLLPIRVARPQSVERISHIGEALARLADLQRPDLRVVLIGFSTDTPLSAAACRVVGEALDGPLGRLGDRVLVVAPVGQAGDPDRVGFPACHPDVMAVGAVYDAPMPFDQPHELAPCVDEAPLAADQIMCANNGLEAGTALIDMLAPGAYIHAAGIDADIGTSMAAAHVAGGAALLASARPQESADDLKNRMIRTGVPVLVPPGLRDCQGDCPEMAIPRLELVPALDRACLDGDGDGFGRLGPDCTPPLDCNDDNDAAYPGGAESCDFVDNDCDGETDESLGVGDRCAVGIGACRADGVQVCGGDGVICDAAPGAPRQELCDGADDDCDDSTDEGFGLGDPCAEGVGECRRDGQVVCNVLGGSQCNAQPGNPVGEGNRRDRRDNDCDGTVDEDTCVLLQDEVDHPFPNCNARGAVNRDDLMFAVCMAEPNPNRCTAWELSAWCRRADTFEPRDFEIWHENWAEARWPGRCRHWTTDRHFPGDIGSKYTWCRPEDLLEPLCPESSMAVDTPLILSFGASIDGMPRYAASAGEFDLSRDQDGSTTSAWVRDPFLIDLAAPGDTMTARHMFGEATLDHDGKPSFRDGFHALGVMADTDGSGWVSGPELATLAAWSDDGDRIPQTGEITRLTDLGVIAIRVEPFSWKRTGWHPDGLGFVEGRSTMYFVRDGMVHAGEVMDVYLR